MNEYKSGLCAKHACTGPVQVLEISGQILQNDMYIYTVNCDYMCQHTRCECVCVSACTHILSPSHLHLHPQPAQYILLLLACI